MLFPFAWARSRPRIVELVRLAGATNAAYGRHTLLPGGKSAIRGATHVAAINGTPWIWIVWHFVCVGRCLRENGRKECSRKDDGFKRHRKSPLSFGRNATLSVRSRASGNPGLVFGVFMVWVPAFAGTNGSQSCLQLRILPHYWLAFGARFALRTAGRPGL